MAKTNTMENMEQETGLVKTNNLLEERESKLADLLTKAGEKVYDFKNRKFIEQNKVNAMTVEEAEEYFAKKAGKKRLAKIVIGAVAAGATAFALKSLCDSNDDVDEEDYDDDCEDAIEVSFVDNEDEDDDEEDGE